MLQNLMRRTKGNVGRFIDRASLKAEAKLKSTKAFKRFRKYLRELGVFVSFSEPELELVRYFAKVSDLSVPALVRILSLGNIPKEVKKDFKLVAHSEIFEELEEGTFTVKEEKQEYPKKRGGHSCIYLSAELPSNFRDGECEGTCFHNNQKGRLCFWPSRIASDCILYEPRQDL